MPLGVPLAGVIFLLGLLAATVVACMKNYRVGGSNQLENWSIAATYAAIFGFFILVILPMDDQSREWGPAGQATNWTRHVGTVASPAERIVSNEESKWKVTWDSVKVTDGTRVTINDGDTPLVGSTIQYSCAATFDTPGGKLPNIYMNSISDCAEDSVVVGYHVVGPGMLWLAWFLPVAFLGPTVSMWVTGDAARRRRRREEVRAYASLL